MCEDSTEERVEGGVICVGGGLEQGVGARVWEGLI